MRPRAQVLKRKLVKALKLPAGQGTAFYEFEKISSAKQFKNMYVLRVFPLCALVPTRAEIEWCCCHRAVCMARPR